MLDKKPESNQNRRFNIFAGFYDGPTGKLVLILTVLFVYLSVPQSRSGARLSTVQNDLTLSEKFYELHIFPESRMLDFDTGSFEEAVAMLDFFLVYSDLYKIKIALPENYQSLDDLELFLVNFVDEEIQVDFIEYPEEDFGDGGFVLWTDSEASFNEELSVEQSIENLREEEYRILESNWLTETQKIKSPISSLQDGWIFIEHPYRNPKKEFTVIPNVIFMELNVGVNADFLKKNKSIWGGSIKPDALRSIIGSFCFSFCEKDEIMPRLPIVIKIKNGMATHWSSGYPQKDWLNR